MAKDQRFLVTGSKGCIGSWVIRCLLDEGTPAVAFDLDTDPGRVRLLASDEEIASVRWIAGNIVDAETVARAVVEEGITHIVQLAALQVPFCQADPVLGAQVNVVGTVNVFEAASRYQDQVRGVTYASSAAVFGPPALYPDGMVQDDSPTAPSATMYGVYKQANEWTAKHYSEAKGIGSVGLRPFVVYGPGRDQGRTSTPTLALVAAAAGRPYHIDFGGFAAFQYARDVAQLFLQAARAELPYASALNVGGAATSLDEWITIIEEIVPEARGTITHGTSELPFAYAVDSSGVDALLGPVPETPIREGIHQSIEMFQDLLSRGLVQPPVSV